MNQIKLTQERLDIGKVVGMASSESCETLSVFVRTTPELLEGKKIINLEYEAYEPMALKQLELICEELRNQWRDIVNIVIYHRLGLVGIGEASLVIAISSPHRETSLHAVETVIDDLKRRVPIWQKEIYMDEESICKENKERQWRNDVFNDGSKIFNENMCVIEDGNSIPSHLIQICVSEEEMKRRIECFVEKKRNEIDLCNIMDFTDIKREDNSPPANAENIDNSMTCARVSSTVVKQEYSKGHLKVSQVKNNTGPQTSSNYLNTLDKLMIPIRRDKTEDLHFFADEKQIRQPSENYGFKHPTILERLETIEDHLNIPQNQVKNIYQRLKAIEERLIFLESISPEYSHFLVEKCEKCSTANNSTRDIKSNGAPQFERKTYSVNDIEKIIQTFEQHNPTTITDTI